MRLSERQSQLLRLLIDNADGTTAKDVAQELGVSVRTVHRELPRLEEAIVAVGSSLLRQSGYGLRLEANAEQLTRLEGLLLQAADYTREERELLLACQLLGAQEPIKQYALASELQVTIATVTADLDELEQTLAPYGLTLLRKRGYGVQIEGPEQRKREMIAELALDVLDERVLFGESSYASLPQAARRVAELAGLERVHTLEQALWRLEEQQPSELADAEYTKLLVQLAVAAARRRDGHAIPEDEPPIAVDDAEASEAETSQWLESIGEQPSSRERAYVQSLLGARTRKTSLSILIGDPELQRDVYRLVDRMSTLLDMPLTSDRLLLEGLQQHLEPALLRLRRGETIRNPLLPQIRADYGQLFSTVGEAVREVYPDWAIPDEEIGYLVMHFGASMERSEVSGDGQLRTLLVCTSGIGSSRLLAVRLAKMFPRLEMIGHVSWYEASRIPESDYDLILSTVELPLPASKYVKLSPLLPEEDQETLRRLLQRKRAATVAPPSTDAATAGVPPLYRLQELQRSSDEMLRLLRHFAVYRLSQLGEDDLQALSVRLMAELEQQQLLCEGPAVAEQLMRRESYGSLILPDSELAFLHTRSEHVPRPLLILMRLEQPLRMGEPSVPVCGLLYMLAPQELPAAQLSLLSEISAMLLEPELIRLLEQGDEPEIRQWLAAAWLEAMHRL